MSETSLKGLQASVDAWIQDNGGYWDELSLMCRLTEEVGELAREYNHRFGAKKKKASEAESSLQAELADVPADQSVSGRPGPQGAAPTHPPLDPR